jgi:glycosyltransferase involved in cell wall biosynthesis
MTKRLFVASGIFHPEAGGPATYLHEVLPALMAKGWDVRLLTFGDGAQEGYPYPVRRVPRGALPLRYARYAWHGWREGRTADLLYLHSIDLPLWGLSAPRVMKVVGDVAWERCIRKGWIPPDTDIDSFQTAPARSAVVAQQKASRARQVRAMQGVIVPSVYLKQMVQGWGVPEERLHVVYNALPPMQGERLSQAEARTRLNLPQARPILLTAARLTAWKGVDHLIHAISTLPDVLLLVVGDGNDEARLRALATPLGERVRFLGRLPRETLYQHMQAADYFALYSGYEGLAHTLLESLRVGTPLIASAKGGNVEVVRDGANGFLVPYVDVSALRDTLARAFTGDTRARLSARTGEGMERFTFDHMAQATHAVLARYAE